MHNVSIEKEGNYMTRQEQRQENVTYWVRRVAGAARDYKTYGGAQLFKEMKEAEKKLQQVKAKLAGN